MPDWDKILAQVAAVRDAPIPFLVALLIVSVLIWWAISWSYSAILSGKNTQIETQDRQLSDYKEKFSGITLDEARAAISLIQKQKAEVSHQATDAGPLVKITGRTFRNQRVLLDGHDYQNCTFENVTLVYNGRVGNFSNNVVRGFLLSSDLPEINSAMKLLFDMGFLKIPLISDAGGPMTPTNPTKMP
jgi:hypothetical protein